MPIVLINAINEDIAFIMTIGIFLKQATLNSSRVSFNICRSITKLIAGFFSFLFLNLVYKIQCESDAKESNIQMIFLLICFFDDFLKYNQKYVELKLEVNRFLL